ncbi:MAG: DUF1292 domain-containing protein [Alphaproteobacteria bacterium]|nr:DUF1292 domain-containing protein [Alphaproteobacteria bacterium]
MAEDDEVGFDPREEVVDDDLVVLVGADGATLECVVLEIVEHGGRTYAVLTPRHELDDEGDLLVATYEEDEDGRARFGPLDDESVLADLQELVGRMMGLAPDDDDGVVGAIAPGES